MSWGAFKILVLQSTLLILKSNSIILLFMINHATLPRGIKLTQFSPNSVAYRESALLLVEIIVVIVMIIIVEVIMVMGIAVIVVVHCVQGFNVPQRI